MPTPEFIDNRDGNTLARALAAVFGAPGYGPGAAEEGAAAPPAEVCIASAFFSPAGFAHIADELGLVPRTRLMIGAEPPPEAARPRRRPDDPPEPEFTRRRLREGLHQLDEGLRAERDHIPFTRVSAGSLRKLIGVLRSGRMEVRRYEQAFLHAKAYIFVAEGNAVGARAGVIAGSSNLTGAGLTRNLELNLGRYDHPVVQQARDWFEALWTDATPFDLAAYFEEVFAPWQPWDIFLRVLWQLYGSEVEEEAKEDHNLPLTSFQMHGVARALRLMQSCGGVIVADEVGLGKTFIAGEVVRLYQDRRQRALLVCPAALRDTTWKKFINKHFAGQFLPLLECVSFEQLANDIQLSDPHRPRAAHENLQRPLDEYQLVVVDEAHNYRNPDTATRAAILRRLLFGKKREVLLLTATPVNNSLWDLFHIIRFFLRQDSHLADRGILSIRERFERAMREDPTSLSPDLLYPIIDATTVKRTRQFVKRHYSGDTIVGPDGRPQPIVFPKPVPITVRYELDAALPGFFDKIETALDPNGHDASLTFARYRPESYRGGMQDEDEERRAHAMIGLLRSGLLKRFESSAYAFRMTVERMERQHDLFLEALAKGKVITTAFLQEISGDDEGAFDELLEDHPDVFDSDEFDVPALRSAVERDRDIFRLLSAEAAKITPSRDPKLLALIAELGRIASQAADESTGPEDEAQRRKVVVFSSFADTVQWVYTFLKDATADVSSLESYRNRIVAVSGSDEAGDVTRREALSGFAPISTEALPGQDADLYDIMVSTDVLAEGVNLQQCRHIINYDMPWNPMRLVQRHGRIDRIGSPHNRVFLRTIFPTDRLDDLLNLEQRILNKLAMAAASIGVAAPIVGGAQGRQVFTETREEIERLLREDAALYERGGTAGAAQTGEEYRQTLRKALQADRNRVVRLPWKAGSGMFKGTERGVFFCAAVGSRTYLRFVRADEWWAPQTDEQTITSELGACLRLIECDEETPRQVPPALEDRIYDFWEAARDHIFRAWAFETDPANLQPKVRPLNHRVAELLRAHPPHDLSADEVTKALNILESPWPRREEAMLRDWFADESKAGPEKAAVLVRNILDTGLEPFIEPPVMPPITLDEIDLICWMALAPAPG